jgi:hypothetical protein
VVSSYSHCGYVHVFRPRIFEETIKTGRRQLGAAAEGRQGIVTKLRVHPELVSPFLRALLQVETVLQAHP